MLIPRQLQQHSPSPGKISVKNFNGSGLEVKPIYKKMPQHSHVNKLLHTAAAGNGVIDDVDGLLTPISNTTHTRRQEQLSPQQDNSSASSKERTERNLWRNDEVMEMMYVMQQTKALDKLNDKQMKSENVFKEVETIMRKNGFVKKSHLQIWTKWKFLKSTYMTSRRNGVVPRMIPPEIYSELHQMISGASECDTSTNGSVNGDNANGSCETDGAQNGEEDDNFDMAHPIFGFRLGLVKNEPIDSGYDTVENIASAVENNLLEAMPAPPEKVDKQRVEKENPVEKVVVPHRGRGRPPKKLPWVAPIPNGSPTSTPTRTNTQLPPLRVAPFAKATNASNALAASRPPPPLTMPPTPRPIRVTNISNTSDSNKMECLPLRLIQPKLLPKPQAQSTQSQSIHPIRLLKDGNTHSGRASTTPSPSYPKLKQVPMRKTPYSLRPDRAIPDLDESFSPPPTPERQRKLEEVPSTSHLIMQSHSSNGTPDSANLRKRRLDQQQFQAIPTKLRKIPSDDEEPQMAARDRSQRGENLYGKLMQTAIVDLSASLRKTQTQMMKEFFNKQHELLEKEHAFQMQQDRLIMETFHLQTQEIMSSVRDLVATIARDKKEQQRKQVSKKLLAKQQRLRNRQKERPSLTNDESSQEMQEHHQRPMNGTAIEIEQHIEAEQIYTDEEELNAAPDPDVNDVNANMENEMHNVFEVSDRNQQNDQSLIDQTSSSLDQHQIQAEAHVEEEEDDEDDDDDDEDDDDDDDDDDSDSDDDDDDDNGSSQMVNGDDDDEHDHALLNDMSAKTVEE